MRIRLFCLVIASSILTIPITVDTLFAAVVWPERPPWIVFRHREVTPQLSAPHAFGMPSRPPLRSRTVRGWPLGPPGSIAIKRQPEEVFRRAWEDYRKKLEMTRESIEELRQKRALNLQEYRAELQNYRDGISQYKQAMRSLRSN